MITASALIVILTVSYIFGQSFEKRMKRRDEMDGKTCKTSDYLFSMDGPSYVQCVALCGHNPNCKSVFYKLSTWGCTGCATVYTKSINGASAPDEAGTTYYIQFVLYGQACSSMAPCGKVNNICDDGKCVCHQAANYNPGSGQCTSGCTKYGTTYQEYKGRTLDEANEEYKLFKFSVDSCLAYCSNADYMCFGVDWNFNLGICYYNNQNARTTPTMWKIKSDVNTWVRNCE